MKVDRRIYLLLITILSGIVFVARDGHDSPMRARLLAVTLDRNKISINTTRLDLVKVCPVGVTRANLVNSADSATTLQYSSIMKTYFSTDITPVLKSALSSNMSEVVAQIKGIAVPLGIYVAPFVIGLILSLFIWLFLCCCCVCPGCCPSKCCQHNDEVLYTKCELLWPAIFLMLLLILAIAASIPGIMQASKLTDSVRTMQCGIGMTLDDLLNGNLNNAQTSFFSGTTTLVSLLNGMKGVLSNIQSQLNSVKSSVQSVQSDAQTITNNIQKLGGGSGGAPNASFALTYNTPVPGAGLVQSLFVNILGTPSDTSTISGGLWTVFNGLYTQMGSIVTSIDSFNSAMSGSGVSGAIDQAVSNFQPINDMLGGYATTISGFFSTASPLLDYVKLGILVFFAVVIGLSVFVLIGVILTAFFDKPKCRFCMYFFCIFMVVILILGFLISALLSILTPIMYMSCTVLNPGLDTQAGFINFTSNLGLQGNQVINIMSVCLPNGNGKILEALNIPALNSLNQNLADISNSVTGFQTYATFDPAPLLVAGNNVTAQIKHWVLGQQNDLFGDAASINYWKNLANGSQYNACATNLNYQQDSLVPSTSSLSTQYIACSKGTAKVCAFGLDIGSISGNGCIDITSCFQNINGANVASTWNTRYGNCDATLGTDMQTIYNNWDQNRRRDNNTGIQRVLADYEMNVNSNINGTLNTNIGNLKTSCNTAVTSIQSSTAQFVDPQYGLVAGLNCQVMGEDIVVAKNTVCVSFFNSLFFLFVTMGTASFAFLFALCCITCTGVRHYKQDQTRMKIVGHNQTNYPEQTMLSLQERKHYP